MSLIVTLSSIPARFDKIGPVLESLAAQNADKVCLYIPNSYVRFPDWDGALPSVPSGIEIKRTDLDLGPATKILPAAQEFAGQDVSLLFCDDDHIYGSGWAQSFLRVKEHHPDDVIAQGGWQVSEYASASETRALQPRAARRWRITDAEFQLRYLWQDLQNWSNRHELTAPPRKVFKRSGYVDVFEGYAGVLVRPEMFNDEFHKIPPVLWGVDDVWLSGMLTLRGYAIWLEGQLRDPRQAESERHAPLAKSIIDGADRQNANRLGVEYFQQQHKIWA